MGRNFIVQSLAAVLLALTTSFFLHQDSMANFLFHFKRESLVRKDLERTIDQFNKLYASFYVTGGNSPGLNMFPAANLIKRRIYQDINLWRERGQWQIHDLHNQEFRRAEELVPGWAVVETLEEWDLWLRQIETGKKTGRRTNAVQVRYHLTRTGAQWVVAEYEVFAEHEALPKISESLL